MFVLMLFLIYPLIVLGIALTTNDRDHPNRH